MDAKEIISHKIGPLPIGAWALIGVGTIGGLYFFYTRSQGSSGAAAAPATTPVGSPVSGSADALTLALEDLSQSIGQIGSASSQGTSAVPAQGITATIASDLRSLGNAPVGGDPNQSIVWDNPISGKFIAGIVAPGQSVNITGAPVPGHNVSGVPELWYPVQAGGATGWLPAAAFGNIPSYSLPAPATAVNPH